MFPRESTFSDCECSMSTLRIRGAGQFSPASPISFSHQCTMTVSCVGGDGAPLDDPLQGADSYYSYTAKQRHNRVAAAESKVAANL
jgi:hypothetical protein